jgi:hypothetical protein
MGRLGNFRGAPGFRGFGDNPSSAVTGAAQGAALPGAMVPATAGGNMTQGQGIVFTYQTPNVATINHGTNSGAQIIQFDNNSTFLWLRSTYSVDVSSAAFATTPPDALIDVTIQDTGNGMQFMNAAVKIYSIAGKEGQLPYILPTPQLVQPNASYAFNFSNTDAAVNYTNLRFTLHGFRIFNTSITSLQQAMQLLNGGGYG